MPRQYTRALVLMTILVTASLATGCGGQKIQSEHGKTPIEGPMSFDHQLPKLRKAERQELINAIREAEEKVWRATEHTKVAYVKGQPVRVYSDFTSKKQLYNYYRQSWSEQLATQLTHETIDLNYSIPNKALAVHPAFRHVSLLSMKMPEIRVTSYYKNTAVVECIGTLMTGERHRIQYTLMKSNDNSRWIVAHKAISDGGIGPYIGNKRGT
ncbi:MULTISPECIES: hypothetical protein [Aneurinibacillus]|nr:MULTISPECIES: hypothetical protein [Aneurinibacillus]MED0738080.1 hypothetical protein [Aneurinibacillus thermoaerophilus]MED0756501.1 hypothetical protein [Aneurinibacillus thermoaerophilus]MED0761100.1 hypothetical protein [Aneurinibacillus thermoaerophilus]QYY43599.1 hypothetical protein K3F53_05080 [Aneurinibacillus thermoaerophilus]